MNDLATKSSQEQDEFWMNQALSLAEKAASLGEVPVGAVIVKDNELIGQGYNQPISSQDPTAHAEVVALRDAAKHMGNYRLVDTTMYVTVEPCAMCAGALVHARVKRLVFGAPEPKAGAIISRDQFFENKYLNHRVLAEGCVLADPCSQVMREFFAAKRKT